MDLDQLTKIFPSSKATSSPGSVDKPTQVSLFDAVRKWTDAEGVDAFEIELDGKRLTPEQIQEIAHSEAYCAGVIAFFSRRREPDRRGRPSLTRELAIHAAVP